MRWPKQVLPESDINEGELVSLCFNRAWTEVLLAIMAHMEYPSSWEEGTDYDRAEKNALLWALMVRRAGEGCGENVVSSCCYDTVERRVSADGWLQINTNNSGWVQDPQDPRLSGVSLPPLAFDDHHTKCDAASNGVQHLQDNVEAYSSALSVGSSVTALAGELAVLLALILLAPESIPVILPLMIVLAASLFNIGQAAWDDYFTSDVWDAVLCALYCTMDDSGRFDDGRFNACIAKLTSDLPSGIGKDEFIRSVGVMKAKGLSNICSYGESADADCGDCSCTPDCELDWDFTTQSHLSEMTLGLGTWVDGSGWENTRTPPENSSYRNTILQLSLDSCTPLYIRVEWYASSSSAGAVGIGYNYAQERDENGDYVWIQAYRGLEASATPGENGFAAGTVIASGAGVIAIAIALDSSNATEGSFIRRLQLSASSLE